MTMQLHLFRIYTRKDYFDKHSMTYHLQTWYQAWNGIVWVEDGIGFTKY